ncbi:MAG TPA: sugar-binding protein [Rariglobus sp.]
MSRFTLNAFFVLPFLSTLVPPGIAQEPTTAPAPVFTAGFESPAETWSFTGTAAIESGDAFQADHALVLRKTEATLRDKVSATSPAFPVRAGSVEVAYAARSGLTSMDNSYNGTLSLVFHDASGRSLGGHELGAVFRQTPWKKSVATAPVPDRAATARLVATLNKESVGVFALDDLSIRMAENAAAPGGLNRMMFTMAQVGHLIFPTDPLTAAVEVWSARALPDALREVAFTVRDYWGAEQNAPLRATLAPAGKVPGKDFFRYTTSVDLAAVPLRAGRYYELHGEIARPGAESFSNYTSFAILPEAVTHAYSPAEIPFTSRTWDQRFPESATLAHRLGIRVNNVWGAMKPETQKETGAQIDRLVALNMSVLTGSPASYIEQRAKGWEQLLDDDGAELRSRVRGFMARFGKHKPLFVVLGNEPHNKREEVKIDVTAYRIVYEELKKADPSVFVIGTSVGLEEDYFKAGFGEWCDAYNFHSYEDPDSLREIIRTRYPAMFAQYGFPKPVWSTEIGMNSQGMTRQAVAALLYKKFANFFAAGGANVSWFGLFYPDPDAKMHHSFASAHNVFDSRYSRYAPKLDAVAYYNAVNGIALKRFVAEKTYAGGPRLFLFRDRDDRSLIIAYRDQGRADIRLPLPGARAVRLTRIDGSIDDLDASSGDGVSITLGEDPVLISFEQGPHDLPADLALAPVRFASLPATLHRDRQNLIDVLLPDGVPADRVALRAPPFWSVIRVANEKLAGGPNIARFSLQVAPGSKLLAADLAVLVRNDGSAPSGLLSVQLPVSALLEVEALPVTYNEAAGPGVKLVARNNSNTAQSLAWTVALNGEQTLREAGKFSSIKAARARVDGPSSGTLAVAANTTAEVRVSLANTDPAAVYHVKATLRDEAGRMVVQERPVAGFVAVPKTAAPLTLDGLLDEAAWNAAPVQVLDRVEQFCSFKRSGKPGRTWGGPDDLSAQIRYVWDGAFLYVAVTVTDDVAGPATQADAALWRMDGLQFLVDPVRRSAQKPGKYEYSVGRGAKGIQTWCTLSADARNAAGAVPDIQAAFHADRADTGNVTYEIAIPWSRLAPFTPAPGANLGFTLIVNDDDGPGRDAFMTWFGDAHLKNIDTVGDLILMP